MTPAENAKSNAIKVLEDADIVLTGNGYGVLVNAIAQALDEAFERGRQEALMEKRCDG